MDLVEKYIQNRMAGLNINFPELLNATVSSDGKYVTLCYNNDVSFDIAISAIASDYTEKYKRGILNVIFKTKSIL